MPALLTSPHLIDAILALTVLEGVMLVALRWRPMGGTALTLTPGICLLLALRAALAGSAWPWVPAALLASLLVHIADVTYRR